MESTENRIKTTKTARFYQLGTLSPATKRVIFALHGYGQLASYFIKHFESLDNAETVILAPEGLSRFYLDGKWDRVGATWMTKEDRLFEIEDHVEFLNRLQAMVQEQAPNILETIVLGFSQGTATAWRWVMKGNVAPNQLILWAGSLPLDTLEKAAEKLENCDLHFVLGDNDEFIKISDAEKQMEKLRIIQPNARFWTFHGEHRMDAPTLAKIFESFGT
jgi:predicted esterase